jgi:hypothetical protein
MQRHPINPSLIRNYQFINDASNTLIQFIAFGAKNKMIKQDDGSMVIVREEGQGKPYKCGDPLTINMALEILSQNSHPSHNDMATHIQTTANK